MDLRLPGEVRETNEFRGKLCRVLKAKTARCLTQSRQQKTAFVVKLVDTLS